MAILKLWWSTSNFFPTDRFSGLTEEAGSGLTVVLRVAGRTDCRLTYGNVWVWGRPCGLAVHTVQRPPAMKHSVPAFWAEAGYTSLPLKRQPWVLNTPGSQCAHLWPQWRTTSYPFSVLGLIWFEPGLSQCLCAHMCTGPAVSGRCCLPGVIHHLWLLQTFCFLYEQVPKLRGERFAYYS